VRRLSHPITGWTYEWADDGRGPVQVTDRDGVQGRFDRDGRPLGGPLFVADTEMCRWIASGGSEAGGAAGRSRRFTVTSDPQPRTSEATS
jgi:hypothetical protein